MKKENNPSDPEFLKAVELMKPICVHNSRIHSLQSMIDQYLLFIIGDEGKELADCQMLIAKAEEQLEALCRAHPEWFNKVKKIKTVYGTFALHRTGKLVIPDEAATTRKIRRHGLVEELLRKREEVDLETCERLPEGVLEMLGIESKNMRSLVPPQPRPTRRKSSKPTASPRSQKPPSRVFINQFNHQRTRSCP